MSVQPDGQLENAVYAVLRSLRLDDGYSGPRTEEEYREFTDRFRQLRRVVSREADEKRKHEYSMVLQHANIIYSQVFYLQSCGSDMRAYERYAESVTTVLNKVVEQSFITEMRKAQIALGFVDVICELLVLEVGRFGHSVNVHPNCRGIRRSLGNALINLTYKHKESKQRLCAHRSFLYHVTLLIKEAPLLAQYYGGLIRNLSWNADPTMAKALQQTVPALATCTLVMEKDRRCLLSLLSAIWNMVPHSVENKKALCEVRGFLPAIISLTAGAELVGVSSDVAVVESATGIIKYLSQHIKGDERLVRFVMEQNLIVRLLTLVGNPSTSPTTITNCFGALSTLIQGSPLIYGALVNDPNAVAYLEQMRNSPRGEVKTGMEHLLRLLYDARSATNAMQSLPSTSNSSGTAESHVHPARYGGTLERRPMAGPLWGECVSYPQYSGKRMSSFGEPVPMAHFNTIPGSFMNGGVIYENHPSRSMSLPRDAPIKAFQPQQQPLASQEGTMEPMKAQNEHKEAVEEYEQFVTVPVIDAGTGISTSMECTRTGSPQSLNSTDVRNSSEWPSTVATSSTVDTLNHSPVSESELPASPTEFATLQFQRNQLKQTLSKQSEEAAGERDKQQLEDLSKSLQPNGKGSSEGTLNSRSKDLDSSGDDICPEKLDESLLCDMINRVLPKPKQDKQLSLLDESIASVMPSKGLRSKGIIRAPQFPLDTPPTTRSRQHSHHNTTPNCSLDLIDWDDNSQMTEQTHSPPSEPQPLDSSVTEHLPPRSKEDENDSSAAKATQSLNKKRNVGRKSNPGPPPLLPKPALSKPKPKVPLSAKSVRVSPFNYKIPSPAEAEVAQPLQSPTTTPHAQKEASSADEVPITTV